MYRNVDLGTHAWGGTAGALDPFDLRTMMSEIDGDAYGLHTLFFRVELDITTGAGGGCTGREICEWFSNLIFRGSVGVPIQGMNLYQLDILQTGTLGYPSPIPDDIAANQTNDISVLYIVFSFQRPRVVMPDQELPCVQAFKDATFIVHCGAAAMNANTTVNACSVKGFGRVRRQGHVRFPALPTWGSHADVLHCTLPDGQYDGLICIPITGGFAAAANIGNVVLRAGDEDIHKSIGPDGVLGSYLLDYTMGLGPIAQWLFAASGFVDWTKGYGSVLGFPLIWQAFATNSNKAPEQVDSQGSALAIEMDGTLATVQYAYVYYEGNDVQNQRKQAQAFGARMSSLDIVTPGRYGGIVPANVKESKLGARVLAAQVRSVVGPEAGRIKFLK